MNLKYTFNIFYLQKKQSSDFNNYDLWSRFDPLLQKVKVTPHQNLKLLITKIFYRKPETLFYLASFFYENILSMC